MKKKIFQLQIPEPCHEGWENMTPTEKGAFCSSCQKEVIDFSQKTPTEIANYFANTKGKSCGRFYSKQLQEIYTYYEPQKQNNLKYAAGLALGLLVAENSFAQKNEKPKIEIIDSINENNQNANTESESINITGIIVDDSTNEPLIGVNVYESNLANLSYGTVTDIDGKFSLKVLRKNIQLPLLISFIGYTNDTIRITNQTNQNYNIRLKTEKVDYFGDLHSVGVIKIVTNPDSAYSPYQQQSSHWRKKKRK